MGRLVTRWPAVVKTAVPHAKGPHLKERCGPKRMSPSRWDAGGLGVAAAALERDAGAREGDRGEGGAADEHQRVVAGLHQLI